MLCALWLVRLFHNDLRLVAAGYYAGEDIVGRRGLSYHNAPGSRRNPTSKMFPNGLAMTSSASVAGLVGGSIRCIVTLFTNPVRAFWCCDALFRIAEAG